MVEKIHGPRIVSAQSGVSAQGVLKIISDSNEITSSKGILPERTLPGGMEIIHNTSADLGLQYIKSNLSKLKEGAERREEKLSESEREEQREQYWSIWALPIVVKEIRGTAFEPLVEFQNLVFKVPVEYQGMKDTLLVLDTPTIRLTEINKRQTLVSAEIFKIQSLPDYGDVNYNLTKYYVVDPDTGIPTATESSSSDSAARCIYNFHTRRIGPVGRTIQTYYGVPGELIVMLTGGRGTLQVVPFVEYEPILRPSIPLELYDAARISSEKLEMTTQPELIKPVLELLRVTGGSR